MTDLTTVRQTIEPFGRRLLLSEKCKTLARFYESDAGGFERGTAEIFDYLARDAERLERGAKS